MAMKVGEGEDVGVWTGVTVEVDEDGGDEEML